MARGKNSGKDGDGSDEILVLTPSPGFDIRKAAGQLMEMMEEAQRSLLIQLSKKVAVEFECGCTRKEIIDGYNKALKISMDMKPANFNAKKKEK